MRVGVILAARAPVPWLDEALDAVLAQAPAPDLVVLVDHASQPPLAGRSGVELVRVDDGRGGPAVARDAGLAALGDCELVALADADDVWEPGKLGAQMEALARHPQAAVCFGRASIVDEAGRPTGERWPDLEPGLHAAASLLPALYTANPVPAASVVLRRDALVAVGGFGGKLALPAASDWDLWLRLAAAGHAFVCEPQARIRYRRHSGGVTHGLAQLAASGLRLHEEHAGLVAPEVARRAQADDLANLARGHIRERRWDEARDAFARSAALAPPPARDRITNALLRLPLARGLLGQRDPYR